ncbi:MAG TPA: hypothetical protein H9959_11265 [Candidatus Mediterraneibacter ornithocaccae]|nr:hypothetical protein [Candidatus Mediterraneibacter ornithocaccae]
MQELEIVREKIQNHYRVVKTDEDLEWNRAIDLCTNIINAHIKHMNDGWIPVEERSPAGYERIGYDKQGNKYMQRLEIAYMTDTIEYVHGYYDGYKWMDKRHDIIENVVAWKIHKPYRPERSEGE